jgi:hypothetical protein
VKKRRRYRWRAVLVGGILVVLVQAPIAEQAGEHHDDGAGIEHRAVKHDHGPERDSSLKLTAWQVMGTAAVSGVPADPRFRPVDTRGAALPP